MQKKLQRKFIHFDADRLPLRLNDTLIAYAIAKRALISLIRLEAEKAAAEKAAAEKAAAEKAAAEKAAAEKAAAEKAAAEEAAR